MVSEMLSKIAETYNRTSETDESNPNSIDELSLETFHKLIPAVVLIAILMFLGIFGNTFAFYYYGFRVKKRPTQIFIFSLTIFDLLSCCLSMPMEIIDIRYYHSFPSKDVCKTLRFVNYFASIASGLTLLAIATDRYRKICKPFNKQITIKQAKICICAIVFLSVLLSWPSFIIYTVAEVNITSTLSTHAYDCTTDNDPKMSIYILIYDSIHFLLFVVSVSALTVIYVSVGRKLRQHRKFRVASLAPRNQNKAPPAKETSSMDSNDAHENDSRNAPEIQTNDQCTLNQIVYQTSDNNARCVGFSKTGDISDMCSSKTRKTKHRNSEIIESRNAKYRSQTISSVRYTLITISITIAFVLTFLPYLCISVWLSQIQTYEWNFLTEAELVAVEIFVRSFLINSAVNPLIYGFFNTDFRKFVVNVLRLCFCCRRFDKHINYQLNASSQLSSI